MYGETKAREVAGKMKRQLDSYVLSVSTSLSNLDGVKGCAVTGETTTTFQSFKVKFGESKCSLQPQSESAPQINSFI